MSWYTNNLVLRARDVGRAIGVNKWIASCLLGKGYEEKYDSKLSSKVHPGDCVWDIGANIGHYTRLFAERVGLEGKVFAFEPSPINYERLDEQCSSLRNVTLLQCGLGKENAMHHFEQGEDELGATSHMTDNSTNGVVVDIRSADSLLEDDAVKAPQIIKMDVEGFEWEVIEGMVALLKQTRLRTIGIEVHFGILKNRGMEWAPHQIEVVLRDSGFTLSWPDASHLLAVRSI